MEAVSLGSGFSSFERDTALLGTNAASSGKGSPFGFSIAMTGASFDRDTLRSRKEGMGKNRYPENSYYSRRSVTVSLSAR